MESGAEARAARVSDVERAFDAGNYARVQKLAKAILAEDPTAEERALAERLLARIQPDPVLKLMFALILMLVVFVGAYYVLKKP